MAGKRILVLSEANDPHAAAVAYALRRKGHRCECLFTPDLPTALALSLRIDAQDRTHRFHMRGPGIGAADQSAPFDTVWLRRQRGVVLPADMHPGDRTIAERQCEAFLAGTIAFLGHSPDTFWVNHLASDVEAQQKPHQLRAALRAGLRIPETLFTNDPVEIRAFLREHGGAVAHKLLQPASWVTGAAGDERVYAAYTTPVTAERLPDDETLRLCPGIYQPYLEKSFEVRVACLGDLLVAIRIDSQADERAATDWRAGQVHVEMQPHTLPPEVAAGCRRLLRELGLTHGSLDLIVDPQGAYTFLEINPQGQFLFLETRAGLPLLDMFSEFLAAGRRDFTWDDDHDLVSFADFERTLTQTGPAQPSGHVSIDRSFGVPDAP